MRCNGDRNETSYTSKLTQRAPKVVRAPQCPLFWGDQISKAVRALLQLGGTVEQALDSVMQGARDEFQCRILFQSSAKFLIDGHPYEWPIEEKGGTHVRQSAAPKG